MFDDETARAQVEVERERGVQKEPAGERDPRTEQRTEDRIGHAGSAGLRIQRRRLRLHAQEIHSAAEARELLLPFATPALNLPTRSVRDTVGVIDDPQTNPELWSEGVDQPEPAATPPGEAAARPKWVFPAAVGGAGLLLIVVIILLVKLLG